MKAAWPSLLLCLGLCGCHFGTLPDPNDTARTNPDPEIMQRNIAAATAMLDLRIARGEITPAERKSRLDVMLNELANKIDPETVPNRTAYRYADILRQAGEWKSAEVLYQRAVEHAATDDRRVNDTLQLARVEAHLGKVTEAIELVRSTFDVRPTDKGPILMSALYEIAPEAKGKGKDAEIAGLLEECIAQHLLTEIDPNLETGKAFVAALPKHIENAWSEIARLYRSAGREDLMKEAINRQDKQSKGLGRY